MAEYYCALCGETRESSEGFFCYSCEEKALVRGVEELRNEKLKKIKLGFVPCELCGKLTDPHLSTCLAVGESGCFTSKELEIEVYGSISAAAVKKIAEAGFMCSECESKAEEIGKCFLLKEAAENTG